VVLMLLCGSGLGLGLLIMIRTLKPAPPDLLSMSLQRLGDRTPVVDGRVDQHRRLLVSLARGLGLEHRRTSSLASSM
jgi:hypothetical protein